jgi:hypothetical protein
MKSPEVRRRIRTDPNGMRVSPLVN